MVNIKINNKEYKVNDKTTILDAAKANGFIIPTLCYLKNLHAIGACRVCVVEVKGARNLVTACNTNVVEGMEITTFNERIREARQTTLELLLSDHNRDCTTCKRSGKCELQRLANDYACEDGKYEGERNLYDIDSTKMLVRDNNKCINCRRCVSACSNWQSVHVIGPNGRGFGTRIGSAFGDSLNDSTCINCGQCIVVCPTGALHGVDQFELMLSYLNDKSKHVIIMTAPAVRVAIGEEFGQPYGTFAEGKLVAALRKIGFSKVFDMNLGADLTIMEEGNEFIDRFLHNGVLPMFTSCSPGWVKFLEYNYPDLIPHLSTCKSPQQMFGAVIKTYYAQKNNLDPKDIIVFSVVPCTAKKVEAARKFESASGYPDVDICLTTRELADMIRVFGIDFNHLENEAYDNPLGESSTAGLLFGVTGGVMEAALRTISEVMTKKNLKKLDFPEVRGQQGIKTATYEIDGKKINVAVASTLSNARILMEEVRAGKSPFHYIEIMACPGGCINGGGQPIPCDLDRNSINIAQFRAKAMYRTDEKSDLRKSHEVPRIKEFYDSYFGKANSQKAHEILHTKYMDRKRGIKIKTVDGETFDTESYHKKSRHK